MISLIAVITVKEGCRSEILNAISDILSDVRAETGCLEYRPTIDIEGASRIQTLAGPDTIVVIEKWCDRQALRNHMNAPHMVSYAEKTRDLIAERRIYFLTDACEET